MSNPIARCALLCLLAAGAVHGATFENAEALYLAGDLDGARSELLELVDEDAPEAVRAPALELLGRIAIDRLDWRAALEAWGELSDDHAATPQAAAVSAAIRPLQALVERTDPPGAASRAQPPTAPVEEPAPPPVADGTLLVGGWGAEYDASQEVTEKLIEFLDANDVRVRATSTDIPAIHGEEVVLSHLLEEARASGASGALLVTTRFNFREYVEVRRYDTNGVQLWQEKQVGGTALKERKDRDKPSWRLVDRMLKRLSKRLGTPDLPTG